MRTEFVAALCELASRDDRVVLLTADLGFGALEPFAEKFPNRYFNVGVAEQGMVSAATGLAEAGFVPYCYSIATFSSLRVIEFFRNGPVAHNLPVRMVGIGAGMDYGMDGLTHFAVDDVSMYLSQPNVLVWAPASPSEVADDLGTINEVSGPIYVRLVRRGTPCTVPNVVGGPAGTAAVKILSLGDAHGRGTRIGDSLKQQGIEADHRVVTRVQSFGGEEFPQFLDGAKVCVVVENHYTYGGLASHVAHAVSTTGLGCTVIPVGVERLPIGVYGDQLFMEQNFMTSDDAVVSKVLRTVRQG